MSTENEYKQHRLHFMLLINNNDYIIHRKEAYYEKRCCKSVYFVQQILNQKTRKGGEPHGLSCDTHITDCKVNRKTNENKKKIKRKGTGRRQGGILSNYAQLRKIKSH